MTTDREREAALQQLLDRQAIHEVLVRWCRGVDRLDADLLRSAYHPDAWDDHGVFQGGVEDFIAWMLPLMQSAFTGTQHTLCNERVEVAGEVAYGETYVIAYHRSEQHGAQRDHTFGGRYVDRFERRDGEWRIAHRLLVHDWSRIDPVAAPEGGARPLPFTQGTRSRDDASYQCERGRQLSR